MTENSDFRRVLRALDEGVEPMPDYADDLWAELEAGYDAAVLVAGVAPGDATILATDGLDDEHAANEVVVDFVRPADTRPRANRGLVLAGAAAAVILTVGVLFALNRDDDGSDLTTIPDPTPPVVTIDDPVDPEVACARYRDTDPTVAELRQEANASELDSVDRVESARTSVERLRVELESSGADQLLVDRLASVVAILGQAALEVERGLDEQAAHSIDQASETLNLAFDTDDDGIPETCLLP